MTDDNPDKLCQACEKIDLFSLFTGPRFIGYAKDDESRREVIVPVNTLDKVMGNLSCPLCRLIKHQVHDSANPPPEYPESTQVSLVPVRFDSREDAEYLSPETQEMLATRVHCELSAIPGSPESIYYYLNDNVSGIQLISPDFVVAARPLFNGFRATTMQNNLNLISQWIKTCEEHHQDSCGSSNLAFPHHSPEHHRVHLINVAERIVAVHDPTTSRYAALSYVWGKHTNEYTRLVYEFWLQQEETNSTSIQLPSIVPKIIEDAMCICKTLSIPYLWVDLYCVHQIDPIKKAADIRAMGQIYHNSPIALVAGSPSGLLPASGTGTIGPEQMIETIASRRYISALPSLRAEICYSAWYHRAWTFQEGQLAKRIAYFGQYDVSFLCGAGRWRESLHSGIYGHNIHIPDVDLTSRGCLAVSSASAWFHKSNWFFRNYCVLVLGYSGRALASEDDKLNAVSGCLDLLANSQNIHFFAGLPSSDFHYALFWTGEYDRARDGFPSWSWAGWHSPLYGQSHLVWPCESAPVLLSPINDEDFGYRSTRAPLIELRGADFVPLPSSPESCSQQLSPIHVSRTKLTVRIESEVARFFVDSITYETESESGCESDESGDEASSDFLIQVQAQVMDWRNWTWKPNTRSRAIVSPFETPLALSTHAGMHHWKNRGIDSTLAFRNLYVDRHWLGLRMMELS